MGEEPTPFREAQQLAAEAWGARRTWWLVNGASQGNHVALLTLGHRGHRVVTQRNAHSSTIDALIMSGLRPTFVDPELDPELHIAHCMTPRRSSARSTRRRTPPARRSCRPPTSARWRTWRASPRWRTRAGCRWWSTRPGARTCPSTRTSRRTRSALGADLVISSIHKIVGSLTQSAMIHLGHGDLIEEGVVDRCVTLVESTSPNALLLGSLDTARRSAATRGRELLGETLAALARTRDAVREIPGLDVLDERLAGAPGVFDYDPLRLAIDVRGTAASGYELARLLREQDDVIWSSPARTCWSRSSAWARMPGRRGSPARGAAQRGRDRERAARRTAARALAPPPPWGELVMTPREAFLGPQEVVPAREAVGRVAAESLAAYPPGIPNVLPGERLTAETLDYIEPTLELGGSLRGASDRALRTLRVAIEA